MIRWSLPLLVVSMLGSGAAQAQTVVPLAGRVVTATGQPVAGADVTMRSSDRVSESAITDATGRFEFRAMPPGEYLIIAEAVGLSPTARSVTVAAGIPLDITLVLPEIVREWMNVVADPRSIERIPGSTAVIDRAEMEKVKLATDDVHQMLRRLPGLNIQEEEGYGLRPNIGMRGTGTDRSSKITLMEDGVLVAPAPYAAPSAYYSPIAGRMESIEVRKGSSQVKYGPMTTGGVLNYVSTSIPSTTRLRTTLTGGGHGTKKLTASVGDSYTNFGWLAETFQFGNDGFKRLDGGGNTGVRLEDYMAKFRINTTPTQAIYQEIEVKLGRTEQTGDETYLGLTDADFSRTSLRRYAASQVDVFESTHRQFQARHLLAHRSWDLTTVVYRNDFHRSWYKLDSVLGDRLGSVLNAPEAHADHMAVLTGTTSAPHALVVRDNNRGYYGAGVQSVLGMAVSSGVARHQIEVGLRYHQDQEDRFQHDDAYQMRDGRMMLTRAGAPGSQTNRVAGASAVAGFVADTVSFGKWTVAPGVRYETINLDRTTYARTDPSRAGAAAVLATDVNAVIPGLGASYAARPDVSVFGGVHRGFAPPGPGATEGTEVEHSVNYELGARIQRNALRAEFVGFFNDYGNLLGRDSLSTGGRGEGDLFNGGKVRVHGLEASTEWNIAEAVGLGAALPIRLAYTFTQAEFRNSFQSQFDPWGHVRIGDELPYVPRHQLHTGIEAAHGDWRARLEATYVGRMRTVAGQGAYGARASTDSYVVIGLSGEYALMNGAHLFASLQNLTNNVYVVARHPSGVRPGLPRFAQVGLKLDFGR